jgi:hypothetical protein
MAEPQKYRSGTVCSSWTFELRLRCSLRGGHGIGHRGVGLRASTVRPLGALIRSPRISCFVLSAAAHSWTSRAAIRIRLLERERAEATREMRYSGHTLDLFQRKTICANSKHCLGLVHILATDRGFFTKNVYHCWRSNGERVVYDGYTGHLYQNHSEIITSDGLGVWPRIYRFECLKSPPPYCVGRVKLNLAQTMRLNSYTSFV